MDNEYKQIDISVCILTYFHEKYIRQAIESVLMQQTEYNYEIIISDDGSTDGTLQILQEYKDKYPNVIRINHNKENVGIPNNIYIARCMCKGRYIVGLSGDDYWIDKKKMQKQCEFLEKNPKYLVACCSFEMRYDNDIKAVEILPPLENRNKEYTIKNYEKGKTLYLHGFMMRNIFLTKKGRAFFGEAHRISNKVDDAVDVVLFLQYGRIFVMNDILNVYRANRIKKDKRNYNSKFSMIEKISNSVELYNNLFEHFGATINFKSKYVGTFSVAWLYMILTRKWKEFIFLYKKIPYEYRHPIHKSVFLMSIPKSIEALFKRLYKNIKIKFIGDS